MTTYNLPDIFWARGVPEPAREAFLSLQSESASLRDQNIELDKKLAELSVINAQLLEALDTCEVAWPGTRFKSKYFDEHKVPEAITALRLAIEQAEKQAPVAWQGLTVWVGLTDEDVYPLANEHLHYQPESYEVSGIYDLARAIEAKLKEKNT